MSKEQLYRTAGRLITAALGAAALAAVGVVAAQDDNVSNDEPGTVPSSSPSVTTSPQSAQRQVYIAQLSAANGSGVAGTAKFVVDGGNVGVSIDATGLSPNMMHPQHVHAGSRCADLSADTNGDGFLDVKEAEAIAGQAIIPLQLNLSSQPGTAPDSAGAQNFPIASENGAISYIQSAPLAGFGTLPMPTVTPSPTVTTAATESTFGMATPMTSPGVVPSPTESTMPELLGLANRVVELHGLDSVTLPSTVQSDNNQPANSTLPVACGVLERVSE